MHTHAHTRTHTHTQTSVKLTHAHMPAHIHTCMDTHTCTHIHADACTRSLAHSRTNTNAPTQAKKILSANSEAPINIECIMDDKDVRGSITREAFEKLIEPVISKLKKPLDEVRVDGGRGGGVKMAVVLA